MTCTCKKEFQRLMENHRLCRYKTDPNKPVFQDPEFAIPKPHVILPDENDVDFDSHLPFQPEPEEAPPPPPSSPSPIEQTEESDIELTDISPEELLEQEQDAERIKQELAIIELSRLTKKRVRKVKPV